MKGVEACCIQTSPPISMQSDWLQPSTMPFTTCDTAPSSQRPISTARTQCRIAQAGIGRLKEQLQVVNTASCMANTSCDRFGSFVPPQLHQRPASQSQNSPGRIAAWRLDRECRLRSWRPGRFQLYHACRARTLASAWCRRRPFQRPEVCRRLSYSAEWY